MQVAASLPQRKFTSVWSRLFRLTHPGNNKGAWTAAEDSQLTELFAVHGSKWKPIGDAIGRLPESCRDRWRILGVHGKVTGRWSEAEEAKLTEAVAEYGRATGLVRLRKPILAACSAQRCNAAMYFCRKENNHVQLLA